MEFLAIVLFDECKHQVESGGNLDMSISSDTLIFKMFSGGKYIHRMKTELSRPGQTGQVQPK